MTGADSWNRVDSDVWRHDKFVDDANEEQGADARRDKIEFERSLRAACLADTAAQDQTSTVDTNGNYDDNRNEAENTNTEQQAQQEESGSSLLDELV